MLAASFEDVVTRIVRFGSPLQNPIGRVDLSWSGSETTLPLELTAEGAPSRVRAEVWTNAGSNDAPERFHAVPMDLVGREGEAVRFEARVPVERVGNYRATGRVFIDDNPEPHWAGAQGLPDLLFRPRHPCVDDLDLEIVPVGNVNVRAGRPGTLADLMEDGTPPTNGRYTLDWIAEQGKNAVWLLPILEISPVVKIAADEDIASLYAVGNLFGLRPEIARAAEGRTGESAQAAAREELARFLDKAHSLGLRVLLDLPLNHLGREHRFHDLFVTSLPDGSRCREVRCGDYSQLGLEPARRSELEARLAASGAPHSLEHVAPWLFASLDGNPRGALAPNRIAPGGWFEWPDTLQLNHGRRRVSFHGFEELPPSSEHLAVQGWLARALRFWAVDVGMDGFRLDHLCGLPPRMLEVAFNQLQADVDDHQPGKVSLLVGEDHDTAAFTQHWVDLLQGSLGTDFVQAGTSHELERLLESPWLCHLLLVSSHDEDRLFRRSPERALMLGCLLRLVGGPVAELAGDHFGEPERVQVRRHRPIDALSPVTERGRRLAELFGRIGRLRRSLPALQGRRRAWLRTTTGTSDPLVLALARHPRDLVGLPAFVFCNLARREGRAARFALDATTSSLIHPSRCYHLVERTCPTRQPGAVVRGDELIECGIETSLEPQAVQVWALEAVG